MQRFSVARVPVRLKLTDLPFSDETDAGRARLSDMRVMVSWAMTAAACTCVPPVSPLPVEPVRVASALELPATFVGFAKTATLEVSNPGRQRRVVSLSTDAPFSTGETLELAGGESGALVVRFQPGSVGLASGELRLVDEGGAVVVVLRGEGLEVPSCPPPRACERFVFDPDLGACQQRLTPDGEACEGSLACFSRSECRGGECVGARVSCADDDPCTLDVCTSVGCGQVDATPFCPASTNPCQAPACDSRSGCGFVDLPDGTSCGERTCTLARVCIAGACVTRVPPRSQACVEVLVGVPAGPGLEDGTDSDARLLGPLAVASQGRDSLLIDGEWLRRLRDDTLTTVGRTRARALAPAPLPGLFYLSDGPRLELATLMGRTSALAGHADAGLADGVGSLARLHVDSDLVVGPSGSARFLQRDGTEVRLREVSLQGAVTTRGVLDLRSLPEFTTRPRTTLRVIDDEAMNGFALTLWSPLSPGDTKHFVVRITDDGVGAQPHGDALPYWQRGGLSITRETTGCSLWFSSDPGTRRIACGVAGVDGDGGVWARNLSSLERLTSQATERVIGPAADLRIVDGDRDGGRLSSPVGVSEWRAANSLVFLDKPASDWWRIRLLDRTTGLVSTLDAGRFGLVGLSNVSGVAVNGDDLFVLDEASQRLWVQNLARNERLAQAPTTVSSVTPAAGRVVGLQGSRLVEVSRDGGVAAFADLGSASGLTLAGAHAGTFLFFEDTSDGGARSRRLLRWAPDAGSTVIAGTLGSLAAEEGPALNVSLDRATSATVGPDGAVFWFAGNAIRVLRGGQVSTVIVLADQPLSMTALDDGSLAVLVSSALLRVVP